MVAEGWISRRCHGFRFFRKRVRVFLWSNCRSLTVSVIEVSSSRWTSTFFTSARSCSSRSLAPFAFNSGVSRILISFNSSIGAVRLGSSCFTSGCTAAWGSCLEDTFSSRNDFISWTDFFKSATSDSKLCVGLRSVAPLANIFRRWCCSSFTQSLQRRSAFGPSTWIPLEANIDGPVLFSERCIEQPQVSCCFLSFPEHVLQQSPINLVLDLVPWLSMFTKGLWCRDSRSTLWQRTEKKWQLEKKTEAGLWARDSRNSPRLFRIFRFLAYGFLRGFFV